MRLPLAILLTAAAMLAVVGASAPAFAQDAACATIDENKKLAAGMGIPTDNISLIEDVGLINDYVKAVGARMPDDSAPVGMLVIQYPNVPGVWVGLVEANGCIKYSMKVLLAKHLYAMSIAKPGV